MKVFYCIVLALAAVFAISWTFNHINAWAGVILAVVITGASINYLLKQFKN